MTTRAKRVVNLIKFVCLFLAENYFLFQFSWPHTLLVDSLSINEHQQFATSLEDQFVLLLFYPFSTTLPLPLPISLPSLVWQRLQLLSTSIKKQSNLLSNRTNLLWSVSTAERRDSTIISIPKERLL